MRTWSPPGAVLMPNNPALHHSLRDTHGGVIATLLDNAGWFTAATRYDNWVNATVTVRLHEPANQEDLVAVGRVVRAGGRLCVVEWRCGAARVGWSRPDRAASS